MRIVQHGNGVVKSVQFSANAIQFLGVWSYVVTIPSSYFTCVGLGIRYELWGYGRDEARGTGYRRDEARGAGYRRGRGTGAGYRRGRGTGAGYRRGRGTGAGYRRGRGTSAGYCIGGGQEEGSFNFLPRGKKLKEVESGQAMYLIQVIGRCMRVCGCR